jgi:branched-chain amino acid transport system ATP-binding protein
VFETALLAAVRGGGRRGKSAERAAIDALGRAGLLDEGDRRSSGLRLLSRKRLELARALAAGPRVLLLDEIAGGLTDAETGALIGTIRDLSAGGVAIVWVEHVIRALTQVATRLVCLADGHVLASGEPSAVLDDPAVRRAYFGRGVL